MKVTFLGTGTSQGVPVIACGCEVCGSTHPADNRLRSSVLLQTQNRTYVIDTGPDFRQQMLRYRVQQLDAIIFTHPHKDHIAGLDDVRAFNFKAQQAMPLYANELTARGIRNEFYYAFDGTNYPGIPQLEIVPIDERPFDALGTHFIPIPVLHHRMPVLGFRVGNFAYVTDASQIPPASMALLQGLDVLVLNALRLEKHISHFTLGEALEVIRQLAPRRAYLTHISHLMGRHETISASLPPGVQLAHDGLVVEIK